MSEFIDEIIKYRQDVLESGLYPKKIIISDVLYDNLVKSDYGMDFDYGKMEGLFLDFQVIGQSDIDGYYLKEAVCAWCENDNLMESEKGKYCPLCELDERKD